MKRWFRLMLVVLTIFVAYQVSPSRLDAADVLEKCPHQQPQGPKITTPTRAFLKRQCDAVKQGIRNLPGLKQMFPNCRPTGARMK
jgi:hypothetical protein